VIKPREVDGDRPDGGIACGGRRHWMAVATLLGGGRHCLAGGKELGGERKVGGNENLERETGCYRYDFSFEAG
jgi:hypothetical protein